MIYDETALYGYLRKVQIEDTRIITQKLNKFEVQFRITGEKCDVPLLFLFKRNVFVIRKFVVLNLEFCYREKKAL